MQKHIHKLHHLATAPERRILGLMSGTSVDGLDLALCTVRGAGTQTEVKLEAFETRLYEESFTREVRRAFAQHTIDFQHLILLNVLVAERHAAIVQDCLRKWGVSPAEVDLLASHGQTVFHAPKHLHGLEGYPNATLQIGDGDHMARRTGIITVSDFRQKHVAVGGEGAPMALYGDYFLFSKPGEDRLLLNLGGIANFTYLPADGDPRRVFATDTGTSNTLMDHVARTHFNVPFDKDALLASKGLVDEWLLARLLQDPFFEQPFPITTGPEQFSPAWLDRALAEYPKGSPNPYDLLATLNRFSAVTVANAIHRVPSPAGPAGLYVSGGGANNPILLRHLRELLPEWPLHPIDALGIPADTKESVLFAVLANETIAGAYPDGAELGGVPLVGMGKISFPD